MRDFKLLYPYLRRFRLNFALGGLIVLIGTLIALLQPYLLRLGIDALQNGSATVGLLALISGTILAVAAVQFGLGYTQRFLVNRKGFEIEALIRADLFQKFQKLDRSYFDEHPIGDIIVLTTSDLSMVRQMINQSTISITNALLLTLFALSLMFIQDWKLALIGIVCLPFLTVAFAVIGGRVQTNFRDAQEQLGSVTNRVQEVFSGIRVVKAYTHEARENERFLEANNEYMVRSLRVARLNALLLPLVTLALGVSTGLLLWIGSGEVANHTITIGQFVQFNAYLLLLAAPLAQFGQVINTVQTAIASLGRLREVFLIQPKIDEPVDTDKTVVPSAEPLPANPIEPSGASVEFNNVGLYYPSTENWAVRHLSLKIEAGQTVAIVGPTGSGKSSLAGLIGRVYDPQEGAVRLNGQDVRDLALQQLRQQVVYVPQETLLFSLPLRDNIAFSDPIAEAEEIVRATRMSRLAQDLAQIPGGLTALVGERGVTLSGGQKQRTAIARAMLPQSAVLIMDDALSSVDARTQNHIAANLREVAQGRTTIIISQRLALVRDADCIFVLEDGKLTEQGQHDALIQNGGLYARMYEREVAAAEHFELVDDILDNMSQPAHEIPETEAEAEIDLESLRTRSSAAKVTLDAIAADMEEKHRRKPKAKAKAEDTRDELTGAAGTAYTGPRLWGLVRYVRRYWGLVLLAVPLVLIASLLELVGPFLVRQAIDYHIVPGQLDGLAPLVFFYLATNIVGFGFRYGRSFVMQIIGQRVVRDIRVELFAHFLKMPLNFFDRNAVGRLMTRLTSDVDAINDLLSQGAVAVVADVVTLTGIIITMLVLDWQLALISLAVLPILGLVSVVFREYIRRVYRVLRVRSSALNSYMAENFSGMLVVQLFNRQAENFHDFDTLNQATFEINRKFVNANGLFLPFVTFLSSAAGALLLFFGGWSILGHAGVTFGLLVAFQQYTDRAFAPIRDLAEKYTSFSAASISTERIFSLLAQPATLQDPAQPESLDAPATELFTSEDAEKGTEEGKVGTEEGILLDIAPSMDYFDKSAGGAASNKLSPAPFPLIASSAVQTFRGNINFNHVNFSYNGENPVLQDVTFNIQAGQSVAIVGRTGAGKTSIISLLCRFYDIQAGTITLDGHDLREVAQQDLRRHIALVLQDPILFSGSIADNIRFGNEDLSIEAVQQAAQEVGADTFISKLPGGYDYQLRERGSNLSAGQRQLISFARAIAYNPNAILIMDEATANVDTESEAIIQTALQKLLVGRTSIIIAHRLSTIRNTDIVIVMEQGRVAEMGSQDELVAQRGLYYQLVRNQYRQTNAAA